MGKHDKPVTKAAKISVNWSVTRGNVTISGTDKSIIEAVEMARWAERELEHAETTVDGGETPDDAEVTKLHADKE
jgi:hypothetical protein